MPQPSELLDVARSLIAPTVGLPTDAALRRAISTAYYAVFHAVLRSGADRFFGDASRGEPGYSLIYRAYDHGRMRRACEDVARPSLGPQQRIFFGRHAFDLSLRDFATLFVQLQLSRHQADYDPRAIFSRSDAMAIIDEAEDAIALLAAAPEGERSDLLALMLGGGRG